MAGASSDTIINAFRASTNDTVEPYQTDVSRLTAWIVEACRVAVGVAPNACLISTYPDAPEEVNEGLEGAILQYCMFHWAQSVGKHEVAQGHLTAFYTMLKAFATI